MKSDKNGCSTCPPGEERYEVFTETSSGEPRVQYDYRAQDGELFSCVSKNLKEARVRRDGWLAKRTIQNPGK